MAGLEMVRLVRAETVPSPVLFEGGHTTSLSLSIPGAPELAQGLEAVGEVAGTDNVFGRSDPGFKWNPALRLPEPGDP